MVNQVERELVYPRNALNNYKNGREPSTSRLLDLAYYLEITPEYLAGQNNYTVASSMEELYQALNSHQRHVKYFNFASSGLSNRAGRFQVF